jgi:hypothetical protein
MKTRNWLLLVALAALACVLWGCGKAKGPQDGTLKNGVYTNRFFQFQVRIPDTWTVLKKPTRSPVQGGMATLGRDRDVGALVATEAAKKVHYLVIARNVAVGMQVSAVAHSVKDVPEVASGKDYLEHALEVFSDKDETLQQVREVMPVTLASREFHRADLAGSLMGVKHHTTLLVTIEKGYALLIFVGAKNEDAIEDALAKLGLAVTPPKGVTIVKARGPEPAWVKDIKLQGISGPEARRLAIINGKTFAAGDANSVKVGKKTVKVQCIAITEESAKVTMDGVDGERELRLGF